MKRLSILFMLFAGLLQSAPADSNGGPGSEAQKKSAPKSKSNRPVQQSLSGCVDQQDGTYVLLDDKMLTKLANLEAVGAGNEDFFAKHLGHKVIVKGSRSPEHETTFKVSSIEDVAAVCAPAQGTNQ